MNRIFIACGKEPGARHVHSIRDRSFQSKIISCPDPSSAYRIPWIVSWIVILILLTSANATSSHLLSNRDRHLIQIAFMNGSVEMLSFDIDQLKKIKEDPQLMKKVVRDAADSYVTVVENMNRRPSNKPSKFNNKYNYLQ